MPGSEQTSRDEIIRLLSDLVAIDSVNPAFPGGQSGEREIGDFVERFLVGLNRPVRRQGVLPGRFNILAELSTPGAARTLLLDSHMDTVGLDLMGARGLAPTVVDGRLTGRGSCDTKASLAAMLLAFKRLSENPAGLGCNVLLLASADEEFMMRGIQAFVASGTHVDASVVGEPTQLRTIIAHKGFLRLLIHTDGKAAHSSNPEQGVNAIYAMAPVIQYLQDVLAPRIMEHSHPLVGKATMSIGKIWGGSAVNVVPDRCTIEIDRRILPGESIDAAIAEFDRALDELRRANPALRVIRDAPGLADPGLETPAAAPIVQIVKAACDETTGSTEVTGVNYGTHASKLAEAGISSVVFGPGDIRQAHTADEFVDITQVVQAAEIYERVARRYR